MTMVLAERVEFAMNCKGARRDDAVLSGSERRARRFMDMQLECNVSRCYR
jgi:hypothetical protein